MKKKEKRVPYVCCVKESLNPSGQEDEAMETGGGRLDCASFRVKPVPAVLTMDKT